VCRGFNDYVTAQTITDAPELGTMLRSFAGKRYHAEIVEDAASIRTWALSGRVTPSCLNSGS
jgi:hypothetical protein